MIGSASTNGGPTTVPPRRSRPPTPYRKDSWPMRQRTSFDLPIPLGPSYVPADTREALAEEYRALQGHMKVEQARLDEIKATLLEAFDVLGLDSELYSSGVQVTVVRGSNSKVDWVMLAQV